MSPDLQRLFKYAANLDDLTAIIETQIAYIWMLERGSSKQAPQGIISAHIREYQETLRRHVLAGLEHHPGDPLRGLEEGFEEGIKAVLDAIEERTPVLTGRARRSWSARLKNGKGIDHTSKPFTPRVRPRRRS